MEQLLDYSKSTDKTTIQYHYYHYYYCISNITLFITLFCSLIVFLLLFVYYIILLILQLNNYTSLHLQVIINNNNITLFSTLNWLRNIHIVPYIDTYHF